MRRSLVLVTICCVVLPCCIPRWSKSGALNSKQQLDARSYFIKLARQNADREVEIPTALYPLTYGLEFEGMSPRMWKFFGLKSRDLSERINNMPDPQQEITLRWLFYTLINEKKLIPVVNGGLYTHTIEVPKQNALTANLTQLKTMFARFLEQASPSPFSHFDFDTRTKLMNNYALKQAYLDKRDGIAQELEQSGLGKKEVSKQVANRLGQRGSYMPHPFFDFIQLIDIDELSAEDSRHLKEIKNEMNRRWEIVSKPVKTYGAFEEQLAWFEREFGSVEDQHKRFVFEVEEAEDFATQVQRSPENLGMNFQAHFLAEMLQLYLALTALEKGVDISANSLTEFLPEFKGVSKSGEGNHQKGSLRTIDSEFYKNGISIEVRHGLGTPDERAVVAGVIMDFLQRKGFNKRWRGKQAVDMMADSVLNHSELESEANCDSKNRFSDSIPFPGSDIAGDPQQRIRQKALSSIFSCLAFSKIMHPLLTNWSLLVPLDRRFAQLQTKEITGGQFFLESEITQMGSIASQIEKLEFPKESVAIWVLDAQFRAIAVAAAQRFVTKHRAADVFLEIIKSALQPDRAD
jgi:hypothetical protein